MNLTCPEKVYKQKRLEIPKSSSFEFIRITLENSQNVKKRNMYFRKIEKEKKLIYENFQFKIDFKCQKQAKLKKFWNVFCQNYFLTNIFAATFHFLLSYIDYILPCEGSSLIVDAYRSICKIVFELPYYLFIGHYMIFPPIFRKINCRRSHNRITLIILIVYLLITSLFQFLFKLGYFSTYMFFHVSTFIFLNGSILFLCKHYKIKFLYIKGFYSLFLYAFLFLFFSYYVVKMELILRLIENGVYSHNRILFKVMIFLYFNFYR